MLSFLPVNSYTSIKLLQTVTTRTTIMNDIENTTLSSIQDDLEKEKEKTKVMGDIDDIWFSKLLLPTFNKFTPMMLAAILNQWYQDRAIEQQGLRVYNLEILPGEMALLNLLKIYGTDVIIAGGAAAKAAGQKSFATDIDVFIPIYGNLNNHLIPTVQKIIDKIEEDSSPLLNFTNVQSVFQFLKKILSDQEIASSDYIHSSKYFKQFYSGRLNIIWIEIPLDSNSPLTAYLPLKILFTFYLLAGTFDIVTCRIAILNWKIEAIESPKQPKPHINIHQTYRNDRCNVQITWI